MRELLLLRHGKSDWPSDVSDFDRPLAKRGKRSAARIGAYLVKKKLIPDRIVTSPALRAADTARRLAEAIDFDLSGIVEEPRLYHAEPRTILAIIRQQPEDAQRVVLVGHNPGMESLVTEISGTPEPFPTAALAILRHEGGWNDFMADSAAMDALIRPRELD
jgi:phosphohistidine phosphatase